MIQNNSRKTNDRSASRHRTKIYNTNLVHNSVIMKLDNKKLRSQHTLIELSEKQWTRFSKNYIYLKGLYEDGNGSDKHILYREVAYGQNITFKKRACKLHGVVLRWKAPLLANIQGNFLDVVTDKPDIIANSPDTLTLDGSSQEAEKGIGGSHYCSSGKVILFWVEWL